MDDERETVPCVISSLESIKQNINMNNECQDESTIADNLEGQKESVNNVRCQSEVISNVEGQVQTVDNIEGQVRDVGNTAAQGQITSKAEDERTMAAESCNDHQGTVVHSEDGPKSVDSMSSTPMIRSGERSVHECQSLGNEKLHQQTASESIPSSDVCSTKSSVEIGHHGDKLEQDGIGPFADKVTQLVSEAVVSSETVSDVKHTSGVLLQERSDSDTENTTDPTGEAKTPFVGHKSEPSSFCNMDSVTEPCISNTVANACLIDDESNIDETKTTPGYKTNTALIPTSGGVTTEAKLDIEIEVDLCSSSKDDSKKVCESKISSDSKMAAAEQVAESNEIQFMDGTCMSLQVVPDCGLAEVKQTGEANIPPLCETEVPDDKMETANGSGDAGTGQIGEVVCVGDSASMEVPPQQKDVSHSMEYRASPSTSPDTSSDDSDQADNEDDASKKKLSENTNVPKFTAPSLEDIRTRGELFPEELPAIGELKITVDETVQMVPVGTVTSSVRVLVVIEADKDLPALDEDTVLFTEDRKPFGRIFEVFGPVASPFYSVRFNSAEEIETKGIQPGDVVYCAPKVDEFTHYVFVEKLKQIKGSDASWENNNEPPDWCAEYSDDDDEKDAGRARRRSGEAGTEVSMDCLPGAVKPGRPGKRKQQRDKKSGSRENKGAATRPEDRNRPVTCWPPSISDKQGHRSLAPAAARPVRPFGQQHVYSPKPYVSPSSFNSSRHQSPGQSQNQLPSDQPGQYPPFSPYRQQNTFSPRSFISPSNFNNCNMSQKPPPSNQFPGQFPPYRSSFHPDMQGFAPPQHCSDVQMNRYPSQQQCDTFYGTESHSQGPRFQSVQFRPQGQHPDHHSMKNSQPRPFEMNHQSSGPESVDNPYSQPSRPFEMNHNLVGPQSMESNPLPFQPPRQRTQLRNPCSKQPRPFDLNQERDDPQFMGQNNPPSGPGSNNPEPPCSESQNEYWTTDCTRNPYPYVPQDQSRQNQPPGVVDTRLMQNWTDGGPHSGRQYAFGSGPRFEAGPVASNTQWPAPVHNRPPHSGTNH